MTRVIRATNNAGRTTQCLIGTTALAAVAGFLAMTPQAHAQAPTQDTRAETSRDIVVTAQRRETRLQETPIAVAVFGAAQIEAMGLDNVGDAIDYIPNVARTSGPTGGNDGFYFVRGIGQIDSNPAGDPGVGTYIDDVYLGRIQGASLDTLDLARVEVLRGPQGTLFGRNTIGGAVSIVTADPGSEYGGKVRVIVGERDRREVNASVDLPVAETFRVKVSGFYKEQEGWGTNVYNGATYGDVETWGGRLKAIWDVTPNLEVRFAADAAEGNGTSAQTILLGFNGAANSGSTPLGVPFASAGGLGVDRSNDPYRSFSSVLNPVNDFTSDGASLTATWDAGSVTLKSISAYRTVTQFHTNDFDAGPFTFYDGFFDTDQEQFSQELQASGEGFSGRLNWLTGAYYFEESIDHINGICLGTNGGIRAPGGPPGPPFLQGARFSNTCLENNQAFQLDIKSWAAFANLSFDLTDRLSFNLGGRYTSEEKEQKYNFFIDNTAGIFTGLLFAPPPTSTIVTPGQINPTIRSRFKDTWEQFTPKVGLDYKAADNIFLYASWAQGFKSGGFDGRPQNPGLIASYDPETIDTYEVGLKTDWFGNRLTLNASGFYSKYEEVQLLLLDFSLGNGFFVLTNAGDSDLYGIELEAVARPTDNFLIQAGLGLMENEYQSLDPRAQQSGIGINDKLPLTPDLTANLGAQYAISLGDTAKLTLRGDYNYRSEISYGAPNGALEIQKGYGLLDLRATLATPNERYAFSVFGKNVTDKFYLSNAQDVLAGLGVAFGQVGAPAEWGAELSVRF